VTFNWRETHHGYYGVALVLLGWGLGAWWLWAPGLVLVADDFAQHFLGIGESPIHRLYVRYLWPIPIVQRLNRWLDKVCGRTTDGS
jgi:hypothetical protein